VRGAVLPTTGFSPTTTFDVSGTTCQHYGSSVAYDPRNQNWAVAYVTKDGSLYRTTLQEYNASGAVSGPGRSLTYGSLSVNPVKPAIACNSLDCAVLTYADVVARPGERNLFFDRLKQAKRIVICACGTSWHAGLIGEYLIEEFARIPVEVDYASEFRYRNPIVSADDVVIVISQSGETADTLAALRLAKEKGAMVMGICNVVGSTIPRETLCGMYTHAGPEVGVASTKAFTAQVIVLFMLAMALSKGRTISHEEIRLNLRELAEIPDKVARILEQNDAIKEIAVKLKDARNALYLGRGYNFPVALEGALKLKEISYIHAEGYPAAEMKHGPIALIDEDMPVIVIATRDNTYAKILSNIEEVRSRKGRVIAIASEGDREIERLTKDVIYIPQASAAVLPLLTVIPLQLLSYHVATLRGCNVDRPRNLAKSVTVE
jgi:glucosamine--fructose-6-phosphate aminotransferase (isomerizing)